MTNEPPVLCASCDRCRRRKTKCDGNLPCSTCATTYMKKNGLTTIEGVDINLFDCVYSPAKKRGPVPGKNKMLTKKIRTRINHDDSRRGNRAPTAGEGAGGLLVGGGGGNLMATMNHAGGMMGSFLGNNIMMNNLQQQQQQQQQQALEALMGKSNTVAMAGTLSNSGLVNNMLGMMSSNPISNSTQPGMGSANMDNISLALQEQILLQKKRMGVNSSSSSGNVNGRSSTDTMNANNQRAQESLLLQQKLNLQQQIQKLREGLQEGASSAKIAGATLASGTPLGAPSGISTSRTSSTTITQLENKTEEKIPYRLPHATIKGTDDPVIRYLVLHEQSSENGIRLRSHYVCSMNQLFQLPPILSNEEYCSQFHPKVTPSAIPNYDLYALLAARFGELTLGALVSNQIPLSLELGAATAICLRYCEENAVSHPNCLFDVARAYFLHSLFRSHRGDMIRYFQYRRVCLTKLNQIDQAAPGIDHILASISFNDSMVYTMYNANEAQLKDIEDAIMIPHVQASGTMTDDTTDLTNPVEIKYKVSIHHTKITSHSQNQFWVQGPPPIFINDRASPLSRSLDALACAIRSSCDKANVYFDNILEERCIRPMEQTTPTSLAVSNNKELCEKNMVLMAFTLIQQTSQSSESISDGHQLLVYAMDALYGNESGPKSSETAGDGRYLLTHSQIQSILTVCTIVQETPLLLYQGGPTYHLVCSVAIMLAHLLNDIHGKASVVDKFGNRDKDLGETETELLFHEALDSYIAVRKVLNSHREKVPPIQRSHYLPHPNVITIARRIRRHDNIINIPLIDLSKAQMCNSRTYQRFMLQACTSSEAVDRVRVAKSDHQAFSTVKTSRRSKELDMEEDSLLKVLGTNTAVSV